MAPSWPVRHEALPVPKVCDTGRAVRADDSDGSLRIFTETKLGGAEHPVDDVVRAANPIVDEVRAAVGTGNKQGRCFTLGETGRHLDVNFPAIVECPHRTPWRIVPLNAVTEVQAIKPHTTIRNSFLILLSSGILLVKGNESSRSDIDAAQGSGVKAPSGTAWQRLNTPALGIWASLCRRYKTTNAPLSNSNVFSFIYCASIFPR